MDPDKRKWGEKILGETYPQVEGPGNPTWEKENPDKNPNSFTNLYEEAENIINTELNYIESEITESDKLILQIERDLEAISVIVNNNNTKIKNKKEQLVKKEEAYNKKTKKK